MSQPETSGPKIFIDRRARRSRRLLKEALFSLILEKGYDVVTITDITNRADLGRTTFYLHYRDKEELLLESIDSIAADLIARLPPQAWQVAGMDDGQAQLSENEQSVRDAILVTFQHAAENAQLYRIIMRGEGATKANQRLHAVIWQKANELIHAGMEAGLVNPLMPPDVFAHYLAGSLLATITWWLEANLPYPPEEMADMFRKMVFLGGRRVLGMKS